MVLLGRPLAAEDHCARHGSVQFGEPTGHGAPAPNDQEIKAWPMQAKRPTAVLGRKGTLPAQAIRPSAKRTRRAASSVRRPHKGVGRQAAQE